MSGFIIQGSTFLSGFNSDSLGNRYLRGFRSSNSSNSRIIGGGTHASHELYYTMTNARRTSEMGGANKKFADLSLISDSSHLDSFVSTRIFIGGDSEDNRVKIIRPNSITKPILRYVLLNPLGGEGQVSTIGGNSSTLDNLKRNVIDTSRQSAVMILQGAGGAGGSGALTNFGLRDASGGGSGGTLIMKLGIGNFNDIRLGGYGLATSTQSASGGDGGNAELRTFLPESGTERVFRAFGGDGGQGDGPTNSSGGDVGGVTPSTSTYNISGTARNIFTYGNYLHLLGTPGRRGGSSTSGGTAPVNTGENSIAMTQQFASQPGTFSTDFFGLLLDYALFSDNNFRFINFTFGGVSVSESNGYNETITTLEGRTSKSGGARPTNGGAGGGASIWFRGGAGVGVSSGSTSTSNSSLGIFGSGGGGGDTVNNSSYYKGANGGSGFIAILY